MRVAVVGTGRMGQAHARAWQATGQEVVAAVEHRVARPLEAAPDARATTDLDGVLADPSIPVLSICTPTDTHLDLARRALAAGKHVLLEKPLARTVDDGAALVELGARGPGLLMVAHVVRFFPGYVAVREAAGRGDLGTVREVRAERLSAEGGRPAWLDDEERSGGLLVDLAVHDFDQLVLLLGPGRRVSATPAADGTVEVVVEHEGGGLGRVRAGWDLPAGFPFTTSLDVRGDVGRARYDFVSGGPERSDLLIETGTEPRTSHVEPGDPFAVQARSFLDHVTSGTRPAHGDPAASLEALRVALAARRALLEGRSVEVLR